MDYDLGHDLLSELPLGIIHKILALVPIKDAIRTSILSKQWRNTWTTLPELVFYDEWASCLEGISSIYDPDDSDLEENRLKDTISRALIVHKGPIRKFKLSVSEGEGWEEINRWLIYLSMKNIRELFVGVRVSGEFRYDWLSLYSNLYSCQKLTRLELYGCGLRSPPSTFVGFLHLRCLVLIYCTPSNVIDRLVATSPFLESFTLKEHEVLESRVTSPNLKHFDLNGAYEDICLCAPPLAKLSVSLLKDHFTAENLQQKSSVCNYTKLLGDLTDLEFLHGDRYFLKYMSIGIEICHTSLLFHRLKVIRLHQGRSDNIKETLVVAHLITGSPNLQELQISVGHGSSTYHISQHKISARSESFWDLRCGPDFTCEKLRVVKMTNVYGSPNEMEFIKFLLKCSPVLETMTLEHSYWLHEEDVVIIMTELLCYERASASAEILFERRPLTI